MHRLKIGERKIGNGEPPFIIAEMSGNHSQSLELAEKMVDAAAEAGADAIKLQTYTADSMTLNVSNPEFVISETDSLWAGEKLHALYKKAATPYEWHAPLFARAKAHGMLAFSSPFDSHAVDFLDSLDVPCFKIASFELTDLPLISHAASKGKPLILSTGMASLREIEEAVLCARQHGCKDIILLKCTSTYPAEPVNTNLLTIPNMSEAFNCPVGLSDHSGGIGAAIASIALGAPVIEKHFVLDRNAGGVDAEFSLEPSELQSLVSEARRAWLSLGEVCYGGTPAEGDAKKYRRSIYICKDVKAGQALNTSNMRVVRPAFGLAPRYWEEVLGKTVSTDLSAGTALRWEHIRP